MQWNQWDELGGSIFTSLSDEMSEDRDVAEEFFDDERMYMGSDSDFSDHALGIDY